MSIIGASEQVVKDNCCGPLYVSLIIKFAFLGSMSDMFLLWVRAPTKSRKPQKVEKSDLVPNNALRRCMQQFGERYINYVLQFNT
jgi:hypothetical protein